MKPSRRYFMHMGIRKSRTPINDGLSKHERHLQIPGAKNDNQYCDIDVTQGRHQAIAAPTNAIFMPLYAGAVTDAQLDVLLQRLSNTGEFWTECPVPSTAIHSRDFDKERYWRGPTWPITNSFIIEGLQRYKARHKNVDQLATF